MRWQSNLVEAPQLDRVFFGEIDVTNLKHEHACSKVATGAVFFDEFLLLVRHQHLHYQAKNNIKNYLPNKMLLHHPILMCGCSQSRRAGMIPHPFGVRRW